MITEEPELTNYTILVRYRTNSGCNATTIIVAARTPDDAFRLASEKVSKRRGVIRIDGGEWQTDGRLVFE